MGIDKNVAVFILGTGLGHAHFLMPAMLAADKVGLHREGQILMHPAIFPENSFRIRVATLEWLDAVHMTHHPLAIAYALQIHKRGRPPLGAAPSTVESVRLDPELKDLLAQRAKDDGVAVSEVIREALRHHLQAG